MKRMVTLILAILLCLTGCQAAPTETQAPSENQVTPETQTDVPRVTVQVTELYTENGRMKLDVLWRNNTQYTVVYGEYYSVARQEGDDWVKCPLRENTGFTDIGYLLQPGQSQEKTYDLTFCYNISEPGSYRFLADCYVENGSDQNRKCSLYTGFTIGAEQPTAEPYCARYIRTDGYVEGAEYPKVRVIRSVEELQTYYREHRRTYYLERREQLYADTSIGFLDACDAYNEAFFEKNCLVFVLLEEGSGSIRHEVLGAVQTAEGKLAVTIGTIDPGAGTCDMAQWHVILEVSREAAVAPEDVLVYLDGQLAWNGETVVKPIRAGAYQEPPAGRLITPDGEFPLQTGGYSWNCTLENGMLAATIADQASRPLPKASLVPVLIPAKYAETIYAYVPEKECYEPTNALGYLVKLDWDSAPTDFTITCWPEAVWQNRDTPEVPVVTLDSSAFYAKTGSYVYEIVARWEDTGIGCYGSAHYYAYIQEVSQ